ncbi:MAG: hypothetical protein CMQ41_11050 [Gammaproteobacteria bacterium]|nr:hypothetical protein [Gammaproteobacteria bacterium]
MSRLLFKMRYVPEDEAQEVRDLLENNDLEFFETSAGNWGISVPAIWIVNDDQYNRARELIDDYQKHRTARIQDEFELNKKRGETKNMWHIFLENPVHFLLYMGLICLILYFSLNFFLSL